ncbi:P2X purinoceptor 7-like [Branchiostoma floridae]|uniref:P2X purinoceptor 7-like n=1 Tax=Branchiostoma floridae TaxID=7739 RepID=A0A9J7HRP7_BRAFL|nr:P2X purinoceptor 7-like [Branchiostoma floridae]XP_035664801.1 P2X purinoceptor 7-like [Branchiostoma floridae]
MAGADRDTTDLDQAVPFLPYQFEPEAGEDDSDTAEVEDRGNAERLTSLTWCTCGHCVIMPTAAECICCHELSPINDKRHQLVTPVPDCITLHPGFRSICLDIWCLQCAYFQYRQEYGPSQDPTHERYRYVAYRQLVRWCWGWLGARIRVINPACAVKKIRETFPSAQYTGFKYPPLD